MFGWLGRDVRPGQLEWYAKNYGVIVIGSGPQDPGHSPNGGPCRPPGACEHNLSYPSQLVLAKQMKSLNPELKLLLYEASGFGAQGFGQHEMAECDIRPPALLAVSMHVLCLYLFTNMCARACMRVCVYACIC
jgi:hypothetical protein